VLKYFALIEVDFPSARVTDSVAAFDDHLEAFLGANWPEWIAACKAIERASGVTLLKNQLAYRAATLEAGGTIPEMLTQILTKVTEA
jgi:putative ATP-dependent endonuclease of OLD family